MMIIARGHDKLLVSHKFYIALLGYHVEQKDIFIDIVWLFVCWFVGVLIERQENKRIIFFI